MHTLEWVILSNSQMQMTKGRMHISLRSQPIVHYKTDQITSTRYCKTERDTRPMFHFFFGLKEDLFGRKDHNQHPWSPKSGKLLCSNKAFKDLWSSWMHRMIETTRRVTSVRKPWRRALVCSEHGTNRRTLHTPATVASVHSFIMGARFTKITFCVARP